MTATAIIAGLLPILWSSVTGSDVMQRIAVPMMGGMVSVTVPSVLVLPAIYGLLLQFKERFYSSGTVAEAEELLKNSEIRLNLIKSPKVPFSYALGMMTFQDKCSACHGKWSEGVADIGPPLGTPVL